MPETPSPRRHLLLFWLGYTPNDRYTFFCNLGKWDAPLYAAIIAIGVPFLGWITDDLIVKIIIAMLWFAVSAPLYWWIEIEEIVSEIKLNGLLDVDRTNHQKNTMQLLYWGVMIAIVIWALFWAAGKPGPRYTAIEWGILVHTVFVARTSIGAIYAVISDYLQASSAQRRVERGVGDAPH